MPPKRIKNIDDVSSTGNATSFEDEPLREIRERLLKTYLDIIILAKMDKLGCMKVTWFILIIEKDYGIQISPGSVYPVFDGLERRGLIDKVSNRPARLYTLTPKGKKTLDMLNKNMLNIQNILTELMNNNFSHVNNILDNSRIQKHVA